MAALVSSGSPKSGYHSSIAPFEVTINAPRWWCRRMMACRSSSSSWRSGVSPRSSTMGTSGPVKRRSFFS